METETHLIDRNNHLYLTKVDLFKHSGQIIGFKVTCYDRVVECHLDAPIERISRMRKILTSSTYPPDITIEHAPSL